jgi:beta-glucosidase
MKRIDEAVTNILQVKYMLGLFKNPYPRKDLAGTVGAESSRQANLQAAQEAMTLLKNEGNLLPLAKARKVLVTGPTANKLSVLNSGWSTTWQGDQEQLYPQDKDTILEAVQKKLGKENVTHVEGVAFDKEIDIAKAVAAAAQVDAIIACIGEPPYCETPGNINDLTMTEPQLKLVKELAAAGKPVILVLVEGRPRVIHDCGRRHGDSDGLSARLGGRPGECRCPLRRRQSGKLPLTYEIPRRLHDVRSQAQRGKGGNKYDPQWPFGYGLSYTTFEYRALRVDASEMMPKDKLTVTAEVTNTGTRPGKEIVQLYLSDVVASVTPPVKVLKRFQKIELKPNEMKTVRFELTWDDLAFIGRDNKPVVEPGEFKVEVGKMSVRFTAHEAKK